MIFAASLAVCFNAFAGDKASGMSNSSNVLLESFFSKIHRGENVKVIALGGSITTGFNARNPEIEGWAGVTGSWIKSYGEKYGSEVTFLNRGVSGTDSAFAVARLNDHVISEKPDLLLLEFAMNDQWLDEKVRQRTYETIIRKVLGETDSAILALFVNERKSPYPGNQKEQQKICEHYNVPFVSWKDSLFLEKKYNDFESFFDGSETVHPNNAGHEKIASFLIDYLQKVAENTAEVKTDKKLGLPDPLNKNLYENAVYYHSGNIEPLESEGWKKGSPVHNEWQKHGKAGRGWQSNTPDSELIIEIEGKTVGVTYCESDQFRDCIAWVTDENGKAGKKVILNNYVSYRKGYYGWAYRELISKEESHKYKLHVLCIDNAPKGKENRNTNITGILVSK